MTDLTLSETTRLVRAAASLLPRCEVQGGAAGSELEAALFADVARWGDDASRRDRSEARSSALTFVRLAAVFLGGVRPRRSDRSVVWWTLEFPFGGRGPVEAHLVCARELTNGGPEFLSYIGVPATDGDTDVELAVKALLSDYTTRYQQHQTLRLIAVEQGMSLESARQVIDETIDG
ncbi:hypothetical protein ACFVAJ_17155 [Agromyces sp. NPDC057679]|uniref:hypothetical protein n=1 Tax=Agromyces sp. NPDC057679 TaxID=3346207 RepID=UPI00366C6DFA